MRLVPACFAVAALAAASASHAQIESVTSETNLTSGQQAAPTPDTTNDPTAAGTAPPVPANKWGYTLGLRLKVDDFKNFRESSRFRPAVGLRYGRWKLGLGDGTEWLQFSGFRKEPTFSYDWFDSKRFTLGASLRIQNLTTGEGFDAFESGRHTLRGRVLAGMQITRAWNAGLEVTRDLMNRGDGSTVTAGVSYRWQPRNRDVVYLSGGATWASASHWRTAVAASLTDPSIPPPASGIGSIGVGISHSHALSRHWGLYSVLGTSRLVGDPARVAGGQWVYGGQFGILYFSR